jgi:CO/xanthine dehydrogenase Mo-binding subunit
MDPVEFRLKNLIVEGDENAFGEVLHDVRAHETLQAAVDAAGYGQPKAPYLGRGVAIGERGTGAGEGTVEIRLQADGRAILGTPMLDQGTGTYTTIAQVASEELGIPAERFELEVWDTDELQSDSGLTGSRGTHVNTLAAYEAAQLARQDLAQTAAEYFGWPEGEVEFSAGQARRGESGEAVGWEELLARSGQTIRARAHTTAKRSHRTSFVAQVAEVAVDPETGEVRVLRYTTAHDSGLVLNPLGYQGQVNGGFQHGLGYALMEELVVEDGRVTTLSFGDYKMPTVRDMPPLETVVLESDRGEGPYSIRGIGEAPCIPVAPAIANAVADAVGVRIRDLPITAQKVYRGLTR